MRILAGNHKSCQRGKTKKSLIPQHVPDSLLDDELASTFLQYFHRAQQEIEKQASGRMRQVYERVFYDTLGGYLNYYMLPMAKHSFYAGVIKLETVQNIDDLYEECKKQVNTNGNGWKPPLSDFANCNSKIEPLRIVIHGTDEDTSCAQLDLLDDKSEAGEDMIVDLPQLDLEEKWALGNIWIPFKRRQTFNLKSSMSSYVLLRYFELTTRCYNFVKIPQSTFNKKFRDWILENLEIHLDDGVLYPGLGGILRVIESLRSKSKDLIVVSTEDCQHERTSFAKKSKHEAAISESWMDRIFGAKNGDNERGYFQGHFGKKRGSRKQYLTIVGVVVISIVFFCFALTCLLMKSERSSKAKAPPKRSKVFVKFKKHKRGEDEELLLGPKSPSIVSSSRNDAENGTKELEEKAKLPTVEEEKPKLSKPRKKRDPSPPQAPKCFRLCTRVSSASVMDRNGSEMKLVDERNDPTLRKEN